MTRTRSRVQAARRRPRPPPRTCRRHAIRRTTPSGASVDAGLSGTRALVDQCLGLVGEDLFDECLCAGYSYAVEQVGLNETAARRALGAHRQPTAGEHGVAQLV